MSDDLIKNTGPKVLASIVIELVETAPGQTGTRVQQTCADEIQCLGLLAKGMDILKMLFAQHAMAQAPRVQGVNGMPTLPDRIKRHFRG